MEKWKRLVSALLLAGGLGVMIYSASNNNFGGNTALTGKAEEMSMEATAEPDTIITDEKLPGESEIAKESVQESEVAIITEEEIVKESAEEAAVKLQEEAVAETPLSYSGPVETLEVPMTLYASTGLNIRRGPGTEYDIVGRLALNESVTVTGITENGWYQYKIGEETCYVSANYLLENKVEPEPAPVAEPAPDLAAQTPAPPATTASAGIIIIGDSRCVQMQAAVGGGGCSWICENSKGYTWLNEYAIGIADPSVGQGTKVVFCLGVNDPGNVRRYAELVNAKAAEWAARGASVYYVSVNPVWENPYVTQEQVDVFNSTMPGLLSGVIWIDTSTWLKENGCRIVDGLHYDDPTSINIFNLIMGSI